jgi:hypothetical protein
MTLGRTLRKYFTFPADLLRLWLLGAGIGMALATYNIMSATQFLEHYGAGALGSAFLQAGILTWLTYAIYLRMHTYNPLATVAQIFAWLITVWFGLICLLHLLNPTGLSKGWAYWAFLANFPIIALYQTIFWSMSEKVLTNQQLKSYRLIVNFGISFAQIITWGTVAFLLSYTTFNKISYLITVGGAFLTAVYLNYFQNTKKHLQKVTINAQAIKTYNSFFVLLKQFYPNRLAWFVLLGALLAVQLDYLFWLVVEGKYEVHGKKGNLPDLMKFLALFWATSALASFVIKTTLYSFLSKQYGLRLVLLAMPILLFFFLSILTVLGLLAPNAFVPENAFIFTILVLCEQIREVLNEAFQMPSYRLYLLPIEDELRADTQVKLDGFVGGFTLILFGAIMTVSLAYGYYAFWGQVVVALFGLMWWAYSIFRLQFAYKKLLENTLTKLQSQDTGKTNNAGFKPLSSFILDRLHKIDITKLPIYLNILRIINPLDYRKSITNLIDSPDAKLQHLRAKLYQEIETIVLELRQDLQNTRLPEQLDGITAQMYRHTRKLAHERKKQNLIADEKLENIIRFIDEKVFDEIAAGNLPTQLTKEITEIADKIGAKADEKIVQAGTRMYKNIQQEQIDIREKHQILALAEAEKNCSLEIIELLYILIHTKYFPILQHNELASKTYHFLRGAEYRLERVKYIEQLTLSKLVQERIFGAMLAGYAEKKMKIRLLSQLLQDEDATVRYYAVLATSGADVQDTYQILVEKLAQPEYINIAFASFVSAGEASLETLEQVFHFAGQKEIIQRNIIYIFGYVGSPRAIELLLQKITHSNLNLRLTALQMLSKLGVKIPTDYRRNINNEIEAICQNLVWNISAILCFQRSKASALLIEAMEYEMRMNYNQIFDYLMLVYDASTVKAVRDNLQSGDADKEDFATELLDIFIDETSKPLLIPLLSPNDLEEKLEAVKLIFPQERLPLQQTLHALLQRGFRQINSWTRACALEELAQLANTEKDFLPKGYEIFVANLVNPDMVLSELAADALKRTKGNDFGNEHTVLRQRKKYKEVNKVIEKVSLVAEVETQSAPHLRFEIAKFMREVTDFKNINGVLLSRLASAIIPLQLQAGEIVAQYEDWLNLDYFVVFSGKIILQCEGKAPIAYQPKSLLCSLPLFFSENVPVKIIAETDSVIYKIPRMDFQEMLLFEEEVSKSFLEM